VQQTRSANLITDPTDHLQGSDLLIFVNFSSGFSIRLRHVVPFTVREHLRCARFRKQAVFFILCAAGTIRVQQRLLAFAANAVSCGGSSQTAGPLSTSVSAPQPMRASPSIRASRYCVVRATNPCLTKKTAAGSPGGRNLEPDLHHCSTVCASAELIRISFSNAREKSNHAAKDSSCGSNRTILRLSRCRTPGLEQKHKRQSSQAPIIGSVSPSCCGSAFGRLGEREPCSVVALNSHTRSGREDDSTECRCRLCQAADRTAAGCGFGAHRCLMAQTHSRIKARPYPGCRRVEQLFRQGRLVASPATEATQHCVSATNRQT
jgi:hypothetical protein